MDVKACPCCAEKIAATSKVCRYCSSTLVRRCPSCAREAGVLDLRCPACGSALEAAEEVEAPDVLPASGPRGEERSVALGLVLNLVTLGIFGWFHLYRIGVELEAHDGRGRIRPGLDFFLNLVTLGLWGIWVMLKYPRVLQELALDENLPPSDLGLPCMILTFFGLRFAALALLQRDLNRHWSAHRVLEEAA